jgi:RNA polymerase sigma-54 factor
MKYFFHSGIDSANGADVFFAVDQEQDRPLHRRRGRRAARIPTPASCSGCRAEGIQIARRTVAKYREELRIPSSSQRKQSF